MVRSPFVPEYLKTPPDAPESTGEDAGKNGGRITPKTETAKPVESRAYPGQSPEKHPEKGPEKYPDKGPEKYPDKSTKGSSSDEKSPDSDNSASKSRHLLCQPLPLTKSTAVLAKSTQPSKNLSSVQNFKSLVNGVKKQEFEIPKKRGRILKINDVDPAKHFREAPGKISYHFQRKICCN